MTKFTHTTSHATEEAAGQSSLGLQQDGRSSNSTPDHKSGADPIISDILERALSDMEISVRECEELYNVTDADLHLVGMVADELRRRRVGDVASYVVNRNINFTNVCIKQCGFCAFSRDFREEEGYMLPTEEIVKRAEEAHRLGRLRYAYRPDFPPTWREIFMKGSAAQSRTEYPACTYTDSHQRRSFMAQIGPTFQ